MDTFVRLAGLGTLIVGLQLVSPERSIATVISNPMAEVSCAEKSTPTLPIYNFEPPDNGGPTDSGQGSGTR